jgi:annexin D
VLVDSTVANSEAAALHEAVELRQLDRNDLVWIFSTRNFFQLRETFQSYKQKYGNSIDQVHVLTVVIIPFISLQNFLFSSFLNFYGLWIFFLFSQDIMSGGKGTLESILQVAIWCIESPEKHFAKVIENVKGFLTRAAVFHCNYFLASLIDLGANQVFFCVFS